MFFIFLGKTHTMDGFTYDERDSQVRFSENIKIQYSKNIKNCNVESKKNVFWL